jgi:uncharacterized protein YndB with AHSA1/START domain
MDTAEASVTFVRTLRAPAREVFAAWIDPELIRRWLAPSPHGEGAAEVDARVGGRYRIETPGPDGQLHVTMGEYRELVPGRRLVQTWVYEGPMAVARGFETLLTVELRELEPGLTELTLKHERLPNAEYGNLLRAGWTGCLDRLEALYAEDRVTPAR